MVVNGPSVRPMTLTQKFAVHGLQPGLLESAGIASKDGHRVIGNSQDVRAACVAIMLGLCLLDWKKSASQFSRPADGKIARKCKPIMLNFLKRA